MDATRIALGAGRVHFVGVAGSGMSALAAYRALEGRATSGSDREFDRGHEADLRARLEALDVALHPQDASGVAGAEAVVTSTAVEAEIADLAAARAARLPLVHRAALLAGHLESPDSIAIAGTSGKSTTTALTFTALEAAGADPGLITGAALAAVAERRGPGNAWHGSGPLVAEADESDGSLVRYHPAHGVLLNVHKDHMSEAEVHAQCARFRSQCRKTAIVSTDPSVRSYRDGAFLFGLSADADLRATEIEAAGFGLRARVDGHLLELPLPGRHNLENALAALAVVRVLGLDLEAALAGLARFPGLDRRFARLGTARGVSFVDDYAHNPEKIRAALATAQLLAPRVHLFFQPHGYGPLRFLRDDLARVLAETLRPEDTVAIAPVYFAGGTTDRSEGSESLAGHPALSGAPVTLLETREAWLEHLERSARPGDLALSTGARDPGLGRFARETMRRFGAG